MGPEESPLYGTLGFPFEMTYRRPIVSPFLVITMQTHSYNIDGVLNTRRVVLKVQLYFPSGEVTKLRLL